MGAARQKRIKDMQESMDRLSQEYEMKSSKGSKKKPSKKPVKKPGEKGVFSVFGVTGKIRKRKAANKKSAQ